MLWFERKLAGGFHCLQDCWIACAVEKLTWRQETSTAQISRLLSRTVLCSVAEQHNVQQLLDCDFIFLAADQMIARLVFNAIVHQYLIPGVQIGTRVVSDSLSGAVDDVFAVSRPVVPDSGCLWCNRLIDPTKLQIEAHRRRPTLSGSHLRSERRAAFHYRSGCAAGQRNLHALRRHDLRLARA